MQAFTYFSKTCSLIDYSICFTTQFYTYVGLLAFRDVASVCFLWLILKGIIILGLTKNATSFSTSDVSSFGSMSSVLATAVATETTSRTGIFNQSRTETSIPYSESFSSSRVVDSIAQTTRIFVSSSQNTAFNAATSSISFNPHSPSFRISSVMYSNSSEVTDSLVSERTELYSTTNVNNINKTQLVSGHTTLFQEVSSIASSANLVPSSTNMVKLSTLKRSTIAEQESTSVLSLLGSSSTSTIASILVTNAEERSFSAVASISSQVLDQSTPVLTSVFSVLDSLSSLSSPELSSVNVVSRTTATDETVNSRQTTRQILPPLSSTPSLLEVSSAFFVSSSSVSTKQRNSSNGISISSKKSLLQSTSALYSVSNLLDSSSPFGSLSKDSTVTIIRSTNTINAQQPSSSSFSSQLDSAATIPLKTKTSHSQSINTRSTLSIDQSTPALSSERSVLVSSSAVTSSSVAVSSPEIRR